MQTPSGKAFTSSSVLPLGEDASQACAIAPQGSLDRDSPHCTWLVYVDVEKALLAGSQALDSCLVRWTGDLLHPDLEFGKSVGNPGAVTRLQVACSPVHTSWESWRCSDGSLPPLDTGSCPDIWQFGRLRK